MLKIPSKTINFVDYQDRIIKTYQAGNLIGKGAFSQVFENAENTGQVLIYTNDPAKLYLAENSGVYDFFPVVFDYCICQKNWKNGYYWLVMERFEKVKSLKQNLDKDQYQLYKELRSFQSSLVSPYFNGYLGGKVEEWDGFNDDFKEDFINACYDAGNYCYATVFEISPRNVSIKNGKLILLDVFFCSQHLLKSKKFRKNREKILW